MVAATQETYETAYHLPWKQNNVKLHEYTEAQLKYNHQRWAECHIFNYINLQSIHYGVRQKAIDSSVITIPCFVVCSIIDPPAPGDLVAAGSVADGDIWSLILHKTIVLSW